MSLENKQKNSKMKTLVLQVLVLYMQVIVHQKTLDMIVCKHSAP